MKYLPSIFSLFAGMNIGIAVAYIGRPALFVEIVAHFLFGAFFLILCYGAISATKFWKELLDLPDTSDDHRRQQEDP